MFYLSVLLVFLLVVLVAGGLLALFLGTDVPSEASL